MGRICDIRIYIVFLLRHLNSTFVMVLNFLIVVYCANTHIDVNMFYIRSI